MNERCEHIESLLPAFVEGDLGDAAAAAVRAHLETCAACRAALAMFTELEQVLVSRRAEVPPVDRFLPEFAASRAAAGAPARESRLVRGFRTTMSVPGIAIILVMWSGFFAFQFRDMIAGALSFSTPERVTALPERLANLLVVLTGGDLWLLVAVCTSIALLLAASTGAMTYRYIRSH